MTSIYGYWTYQDLIQTYDLADLRRASACPDPVYGEGTIMRWLVENGYTLFVHLLQTAQMDHLAGQAQFNTTLFVCDDERMLKEYGEAFFMQLDRSSARRLVMAHSLPRVVRTPSLFSRRVAVLDTKDPQTVLTFTNNRGNLTVMSSRTSTWCNLIRQVDCTNGVVMVMNGFFVPQNF